MKFLFVSAGLLVASLAYADDLPDAKETMRSRMLEDAKRKAAEAATKAPVVVAPAKLDKESKLAPVAAAEAAPLASVDQDKAPEKKITAAAENTQAAKQPAAVLPKVEVKKARITVLDLKLQEQQREIAREEKLTKPTELDKALNDSKVVQKLSILGGQSADYRANLAKERVSMMKDESDIIEAIAHAKTKEEKAGLQKQLDELRAFRRDLEKSMR